ncbi:MAG: hypothetical protein HYZ85_02585 [Candidatus Omnitrophica bacterium]|nr:hypothetical protein [Candidatus Omnitrophota bacterium]
MILLLPLFPIALAGVLLFIKENNKSLLRGFAMAGAFFPFALVLYFLFQFKHAGDGFRFYVEFPWISTLGIHYQAGMDGINLVLCLLHALVSFAGVFLAVKTEKRLKEYLFFYLVLIGAMYGVFTSLNLFFLYFFYEFTLIPLYPMIGLWGSKNKEYGAMKLTLFITSGAVLGLFGILLLYKELGSFDVIVGAGFPRPDPGAVTALLRTDIQNHLAPFFLIGFGVIASLWQLHSW